MVIRLLDEPQIDPAMDAAIRWTLTECFPHNAALFSAGRYWRGHVPLFTGIALDKDIVVACATVLDCLIRVDTNAVRVAGVGNVCVLPAYRGGGMIDRILTEAIDEAKRRGFLFGLLFCRPEIMKVYARTGWKPCMDRRFSRIDHQTGQTIEILPEHGKMILRLADVPFPPGDIDLLCDKW